MDHKVLFHNRQTHAAPYFFAFALDAHDRVLAVAADVADMDLVQFVDP